ncbi:hypothetical protein TNIN_227921 [Trichonephila inaurata madagascariensis]|uniref:Uncharacterized protein n=1 Tax=Trichonephila inaurata madagascariensis TaxID=2747483 RepID=A0A8X7CM98_9ARAC|nr:hypothetical protein TNIN_227921 [Trichonephila inaurata madagascariensis]
MCCSFRLFSQIYLPKLLSSDFPEVGAKLLFGAIFSGSCCFFNEFKTRVCLVVKLACHQTRPEITRKCNKRNAKPLGHHPSIEWSSHIGECNSQKRLNCKKCSEKVPQTTLLL